MATQTLTPEQQKLAVAGTRVATLLVALGKNPQENNDLNAVIKELEDGLRKDSYGFGKKMGDNLLKANPDLKPNLAQVVKEIVNVDTMKADVALVIRANAQLGAAPRASAPAGQEAAIPTPDQVKAPHIQKVGGILASLGMDVSSPEKFNKSATDLKDLIAVVAKTKTTEGKCLPGECDDLVKGLQGFLGDPKRMGFLQQVRSGQIQDDLAAEIKSNLKGTDSLAGLATIKSRFQKNYGSLSESDRLKKFLTEMAEAAEKNGKPEDAAAYKKIMQVNPALMDKIPQLLDVMKNDGAGFLTSVKAIYTPEGQLNVAATSVAPAAGASGATVRGAAAAPPAGAPATQAAAGGSQQQPTTHAEKLEVAVNTVELGLLKFVAPMLGKAMGVAGQFGLGSVLPTITEADLKDGAGNFGANSQKMVATLVMGLKEMAGIEPADGTYSKDVGETLLHKIMTDDKMKMVRDQIGIQKMTPELAELVLAKDDPQKPADSASAEAKASYERVMKLREKTKELNNFFQQLNYLEEKKKLLAEEDAKQVTKGNMMIDAASSLMDKWAPGMKKWLTDFLQNSQIGQMITGVLGMMGMDVSRLWGEKHTPDQLRNDSIAKTGAYFDSEFKKAQAQNPTVDFATQMAATKTAIMKDFTDNTGKVSATLGVFFPGLKTEELKKVVETSLDNAAKAADPAAAKAAFTKTLQDAADQWSKNKTLDFSKLERRIIGQEAGRTGTTTTDVVQRAVASGTATQEDAAKLTVPQAGAPTALKAAAELKKGAMQFTVGDRVVTMEPRTDEAASGMFKQGPVRLASGRVKAITDVIGDDANFAKLGLTTVSAAELKAAGDKMTPAVVKGLTEMLVRAQVEADPKIDADKLHMKLDAKGQSLVVDYMRKHKVEGKALDTVGDALGSLGNDFESYANKKLKPKNPPSVLDQSYYGNLFKPTIEVKPAPAPAVAPAAVAAVPGAAPARGAAAAAPAVVDPFANVAVDEKDKAIFAMYKALKGNEKGENCKPLFFAMGPDGKLISAQDYMLRKTGGEDMKDFWLFTGIVNQADPKNPKFEVLSLGGVENYATNGFKLSPEVYTKLAQNYNWTVDGKAMGKDCPPKNTDEAEKLKLGINRHISENQFGLVKPQAAQVFNAAVGQPAPGAAGQQQAQDLNIAAHQQRLAEEHARNEAARARLQEARLGNHASSRTVVVVDGRDPCPSKTGPITVGEAIGMRYSRYFQRGFNNAAARDYRDQALGQAAADWTIRLRQNCDDCTGSRAYGGRGRAHNTVVINQAPGSRADVTMLH